MPLAVPTALSLANFYGEREIELYCWDESKETCDIMCRVLRYFFFVSRIRNYVYSLPSVEQALDATNAVINCSGRPIGVPVPVFQTHANGFGENWNLPMDELKFQCLRWINREEYPSVEIHQESTNSLVQWLNQL